MLKKSEIINFSEALEIKEILSKSFNVKINKINDNEINFIINDNVKIIFEIDNNIKYISIIYDDKIFYQTIINYGNFYFIIKEIITEILKNNF